MAEEKQRDVALIIGLLIPVLMIIFIAGAIYLPRLFSDNTDPQHDFLYMVGYPYDANLRYLVQDHHLVKEELPPEQRYPARSVRGDEVWFYRHQVASNSSNQLSFAEAAKLWLDSAPTSPDGYTIVPGRKSELFFPLFVTNDYRTHYLQRGSTSIKLALRTGEERTPNRFTFMGWILPPPTPPASTPAGAPPPPVAKE